jgi:hypothetical protein
MPLNKATLAKDIADVFKSQPDSGAVAAQKIAAAYDTYCKAGQALPGLPIFTGTEAKRFEAPIAAALSAMAGASGVAAAFMAGFMAYWMSPPVMFSGGPAMGVVTAAPGGAAITGVLSGALANVQNTEDLIGDMIATALDTATKTVLVTYTTPPPPAGPPPPALVM